MTSAWKPRVISCVTKLAHGVVDEDVLQVELELRDAVQSWSLCIVKGLLTVVASMLYWNVARSGGLDAVAELDAGVPAYFVAARDQPARQGQERVDMSDDGNHADEYACHVGPPMYE
jgi:hypothetical protein